jgi:hypothetical protein
MPIAIAREKFMSGTTHTEQKKYIRQEGVVRQPLSLTLVVTVLQVAERKSELIVLDFCFLFSFW